MATTILKVKGSRVFNAKLADIGMKDNGVSLMLDPDTVNLTTLDTAIETLCVIRDRLRKEAVNEINRKI